MNKFKKWRLRTILATDHKFKHTVWSTLKQIKHDFTYPDITLDILNSVIIYVMGVTDVNGFQFQSFILITKEVLTILCMSKWKKGDTACLVSYSYTSRELFSVLEDDKLTCTGGNSYRFRDVSEISYWFLLEEGLLVGDKLTWTENLARDPWLIYLGGGFTWDRFEKQNVLNKLNFLYMVYVYLWNLYYLVNIIWTWRTSNCKKPQG